MLSLKPWRERVPKPVLSAAVCCFVAGYVAHIYAITNLIPNSDGISRVYDAQQMTISGRWFLHYATAWNGYLQAPAVIGFFAVLFLALAAGLTVSLLRLQSPVLGGLCGALMAVFPSVAYTFLYLFTASAYCFGVLLAVLAVWLTARTRLGFLPGALLLACAVGTYQAYLAVAAALALMAAVLFGLEGGKDPSALLRTALRYLALLVLGLLLYYGILRIFLAVKDLTLLNYKGISSFGLAGIFAQIGPAYRTFFSYFFEPGGFASYTTPAAVAGNGVLALAALWALGKLVRRNRLTQKPLTLALTLLLAALLPLALNLTVLMGEAMPIMRYALVLTYVLDLCLVDRALALGEAKEKKRSGKAPAGWSRLAPRLATGGAAVLLLLVSFFIDNLAYTVSAQAHRATESFAARLVERVESTPGYVQGMEVLIIGGFPSGVYHSDQEVFALVEDYSNLSSSVLPLNKHVYYYLNDWLNVPWPEPREETMIAVSNSADFQAMPLYPSDGSVVIRDGKVIVKLASRYTPKKDYEIAYENRR